MDRIGIRELRQHASRWLKRVEAGESFEVTDRGRPVAVLVPVLVRDSRLDQLLRAGELTAPTAERAPRSRIRLSDGSTASQVLADLRSEDRG